MARRSRLGHVAAVSRAADSIHDEMMGRVVASVRTAVPLDDALRGQIVQRLSSVLNREVKLRESVDPELIGGMVIRIGDRVFDNSVSTRLDKMSRKVRAGFAGRLMQSFESFTTN
jgi:F-type H+-transporting ATPase subunit delta